LEGRTAAVRADGYRVGFACGGCVAASDDELRRRLHLFAEEVDRAAAALRRLAEHPIGGPGRVKGTKLPTVH
jgi:hypothetical protein